MRQIYAKKKFEYSILIKIPFYSEVFALVMIEDRCITLNKAQIVFDLGGEMTKASKKEDRDSTEKRGFKIPDFMGIFPSCVCVCLYRVFF